jgi:prepilin-type N-terminal cleavage/methylation domain-containing protein
MFHPMRIGMRAQSSSPRGSPGVAVTLGRAPAGFSLIELTVVVVIIGIVAAMAIPRFGGSLAHRRVEAAARRVSVDLALAQRRAKLTSASQKVTFDVDANTYVLVGALHLDHPEATYTVSLVGDPYAALITKADFGGDADIVFDGYGQPDSGGTVVVGVGEYYKTITLDVDTGRVSIADGGGVPAMD